MNKTILFLIYIPRKLAQGLIRIYQWTISPDHGLFRARYPYGFCRFYPSCSQYGYIAIGTHGVIRGGLMTAWRILRCNPWTKPSIDKVALN